jgi:hypothetical protein
MQSAAWAVATKTAVGQHRDTAINSRKTRGGKGRGMISELFGARFLKKSAQF